MVSMLPVPPSDASELPRPLSTVSTESARPDAASSAALVTMPPNLRYAGAFRKLGLAERSFAFAVGAQASISPGPTTSILSPRSATPRQIRRHGEQN